ncbi:MAG: helix-turn-helix transcriptional regulator [Bacteroidetes Order II. Incertae sedis bacterium]|jgi:AraC family transcriptional regulator, exoenzyme S synthesis regulatory protein ExsA|nr:helix-turn-helix transcriptional regulator [Bacteroidetes Order II. bacterium]MBT4603577.1 helix-turn-helix transcriptional regulator [Bacteroidetes Order II. bacterium]MBT5250781.1 helix-turn-helix transcriptional regulator [Bacteroidetes Order II. bacterium]MBT6199078.1 helix-turn-helix transcriptional regulator [Bacteroidetes Order II. bacterium]MBT6425896.1 helix-turn-helix transcriptional regulator [Bacteroidetes Order II. bacterium]
MKIINLPGELDLDYSDSIIVYDYESTTELSKQQILLSRNTFSFLQEGSKEVFFDNSSYAIDSSRFLLMKSGHCLMTEKLSSDSNHYRSILFFFSNEAVLQFIRKYELEPSNFKNLFSTYSFEYDSFIKRFVDSLTDILILSPHTRKRILATKFEEIMLYLAESNGVEFLYSLISNSDNNKHQFVQTIESNKLNKLTIKELSFLTNMSVSTFKREFEKYFHTSPSKWFQDKRLEHSAFLLKYQNERPSDIFEEIGYESLSNFIQAFKVKFGVTPKQYQST